MAAVLHEKPYSVRETTKLLNVTTTIPTRCLRALDTTKRRCHLGEAELLSD
jgi:hypothetical protein